MRRFEAGGAEARIVQWYGCWENLQIVEHQGCAGADAGEIGIERDPGCTACRGKLLPELGGRSAADFDNPRDQRDGADGRGDVEDSLACAEIAREPAAELDPFLAGGDQVCIAGFNRDYYIRWGGGCLRGGMAEVIGENLARVRGGHWFILPRGRYCAAREQDFARGADCGRTCE